MRMCKAQLWSAPKTKHKPGHAASGGMQTQARVETVERQPQLLLPCVESTKKLSITKHSQAC